MTKPPDDGIPLYSIAHPGDPFGVNTMFMRIASIIGGGCVDRDDEEKARKVLEALRKPTPAMKAVTDWGRGASCQTCGGIQENWTAMIDAALKE